MFARELDNSSPCCGYESRAGSRGWSIATAACLLIGCLAGAGCGRQASLEIALDFQRAQEAFDNARSADDYLKAANLYGSIRERGIVSAAVLYNQGNALMRAGRRGRAIAAYREALRYRPRDPNLAANLRFALDSDQIHTRGSLLEYVFFWQNWLGYGEKFVLAAVAVLLTFAVAVAGLWLPPRRFWFWSTVGGLTVTSILIASAAYDWYRFDHLEHGVVVVPEIVARKGNGESYEPAFADPLAEGTQFIVADRRGDWLLIQLDDTPPAWIPESSAVLY
jgi:tetratricopeptide (TPR) repeat protein